MRVLAKGVFRVVKFFRCFCQSIQSNCSTVNQNSDSVKTFRDKKTPTVNPVSDIVNHISLTALKVSTKIREGQMSGSLGRKKKNEGWVESKSFCNLAE